jgi:ComEC/Rec2-related protein
MRIITIIILSISFICGLLLKFNFWVVCTIPLLLLVGRDQKLLIFFFLLGFFRFLIEPPYFIGTKIITGEIKYSNEKYIFIHNYRLKHSSQLKAGDKIKILAYLYGNYGKVMKLYKVEKVFHIPEFLDKFKYSAIYKALLFADPYFPQKEFLSKLGIVHFFVISGLHINIVYGMINWSIKKFLCPFFVNPITISRVISLLGITLYYFSLLPSPPALRAVLMFIFKELLMVFTGCKMCRITNLFFTFVIMLMYKPYFIFNLSFQLSFWTTFLLNFPYSYISIPTSLIPIFKTFNILSIPLNYVMNIFIKYLIFFIIIGYIFKINLLFIVLDFIIDQILVVLNLFALEHLGFLCLKG